MACDRTQSIRYAFSLPICSVKFVSAYTELTFGPLKPNYPGAFLGVVAQRSTVKINAWNFVEQTNSDRIVMTLIELNREKLLASINRTCTFFHDILLCIASKLA